MQLKHDLSIIILFQQFNQMFPYLGLPSPLYSYQPFQFPNATTFNFNPECLDLANYIYFVQRPFVQPNFYLNEYLSSTQDSNSFNELSQPFKEDFNSRQNVLKNQKSECSTTKNQNAQFQPLKLNKTKAIRKSEKELRFIQKQKQLKQKKTKDDRKKLEQQYAMEEDVEKKRTAEQEHLFIKYRKKNTESNIVNRIYSFLTTEFKNKKQIFRLGITEQKKLCYLKYLLTVAEAWKGPIKRQLIFNLLNINEQLPALNALEKMFKFQGILSIKQFEYLNRVLVKMYLTKIAQISIITSKKMKKAVWRQHIQKIRELSKYFFQNKQKNQQVESE